MSPLKSLPSRRSDGRRTCPRCGAAFTCDLLAGKQTCWCTSFPPLMPLDDQAKECLCPDCLKKAIAERTEEH